MDKRKKILLGNEDIISRENEDFYIDLNLVQTSSEIIPYKFDNKFDVLKQYKKERNSSRNFRIYGTIESVFENCDNLPLHIFNKFPIITDNNDISNNDGYIKTVMTIPAGSLAWNYTNIFKKHKGKYLIELDNYTDTDSIFLYFSSLSIATENVHHQQLVYRYETLDIMNSPVIKVVPYGTDGDIVNLDGSTLTVFNDFNFFFNKHWIKKNINLNFERQTYWTTHTSVCLTREYDVIWSGNENDFTCIGTQKHYNTLIEVLADTLSPIPNANTKLNVTTDADYIPNFYNSNCVSTPTLYDLSVITAMDSLPTYGEATGGYVYLTPSNGGVPGTPFSYGQDARLEAYANVDSAFIGFEDYSMDTLTTEDVLYGTSFDLGVTAASKYMFSGGPSRSTTIFMDSDKIVRANFVATIKLNVILYGGATVLLAMYNNDSENRVMCGSPIRIISGGIYLFPKNLFVVILAPDNVSHTQYVYIPADASENVVSGEYAHGTNLHNGGWEKFQLTKEYTLSAHKFLIN